MHTYKPKTSHSNNSIIYVRILLRFYHLNVSNTLHFITYAILLLHLQSALQPLWVLACSTIVEYSQQEGFYRVPLPVARLTPNLEDCVY